MIDFKTTATLTHVPRAGQFTTEYMREQWEKNEGKVGHRDVWEEPSRFGTTYKSGSTSYTRYTTLRCDVDASNGKHVDFWITEERVGTPTFERLVALEPGARLQLSGELLHDTSYWSPRVSRARVVAEVTA